MGKGGYIGGSTIIDSNMRWNRPDPAEEKTEKIGPLQPSDRDIEVGERLKSLSKEPENANERRFGNAPRIFKAEQLRKLNPLVSQAAAKRQKAIAARAPALQQKDLELVGHRELVEIVFGPKKVTKQSRKRYPKVT